MAAPSLRALGQQSHGNTQPQGMEIVQAMAAPSLRAMGQPALLATEIMSDPEKFKEFRASLAKIDEVYCSVAFGTTH